MVFKAKKLKPTRIFQCVVDQIQTAILDGTLRPGDVLPPEMKLKEMFDTSRGTIREALRVLEQKGLVNIRTGVGGGAIVKAPDTDKVSESLSLFVQTRSVSHHRLAEFREGVEGIVTALAADRATEKDIRRLRKILSQARTLLEKDSTDWKNFTRLDVQLHIAVAEIADNPVFVAALKMVHDNIMGSCERFSISFSAESLGENYRDLCNIVDAISEGDASRAKRLAREHVRKFTQIMKAASQGR
ncbi:FadR family transcriptional regulator [Desulfonema ishimotonii]|uniref:FadR family transcriptional regulator n=1 Tax=Desulfonema ishimotonii TaxID=45657 RepID=A0A401FZH1_9BACT|nr:FadR/GntR family transcriptional regulator [Desulfonema ishimotonii]GBC62336.1 FadR family transcriptional regulator [Desulfonema ishimotonii]